MTPTGSRSGSRRRATLLIGALLGLATVLGGATAASAHVRVSGTDAKPGGYGELTFLVPTESADASTTRLSVTLPSDTPIVFAATQPVPGWRAKVTTAKLATPVKTDDGEISTYVSKVTWVAKDGSGIRPGQFQEFKLAVGPLPDRSELAFPALQTYSDGTTVNWNERSTGSAEPEHPAPILTLARKPGSTGASGEAAVLTAQSGGSDDSALFVAGAGVILGALATALAAVALLRTSRRTSATR